MNTPNTCPKCDGDMEKGWILDSGHSSAFQSCWVEGEPEPSLFAFMTGGKTVRGRLRRPIQSYRCKECGYLESYVV